MTEFTVQTRPEGDVKRRSKPSRHRAEPAKPASALSRFTTGLGSTGRRAAVVAAACAVLVGAGAAGQASETATRNASSASSATKSAVSADPLQHLDFERVLVANQTVSPPADAPAPVAEVKPAELPAPAAAPAPEPAPVPVAVDDPAGAQAYAASQLGAHGWDAGQMQCLVKLWTKESDWKTTATNPSSGAYGVVQSLPAEKMASAGADYLTNYRTQINWGLNYVQERYGSPCGALNFHYANNWY
ncbi:hypothetical protein [Pseudarthrobacter sp. PH31-O2]|uniref:aggregation-promoting factor C-terminal-like domain-containing protein n=1 Tax=Micrococcaceae TaxID=1268 RepID=UPI0024BA51D1|nr:hypothetical protein [Pseudarthrobacter sp. PH31-O2]MDJ0353080.1 hypothetical protein [Pseudarthrobacter sp. PH31-O2]